MSLWDKLGATMPGKLARGLGNVRYNRGHEMSKEDADAMSSAEAYLESLALKEIEATMEPWVREFVMAKAKPKAKGAP